MKTLRISYLCIRGATRDAHCIVLPLTDDNARDLLTYQRESRLISGPGYDKGLLATTLDRLAKLQGYTYARMISALPID